MGFFDALFDDRRVYDEYELKEYFKEEILGQTSLAHEKKTTNLRELAEGQIKKLYPEYHSFEFNRDYNCTISKRNDGIFVIEYHSILFLSDVYGGHIGSCNLHAKLFANKYAELVNTEAEKSIIGVGRR